MLRPERRMPPVPSPSNESDDMNKKSLFYGLLLSALLSTQAQARKPLEKYHLVSSLQCLDRRIELQADCHKPDNSGSRLECTSQRLDFFNTGTGKKLNSVVFPPSAKTGLIDYKLQYVRCGQTDEREKYVEVVSVNGERCEDCERLEVFSWDGAPLGRYSPKGGNSKFIEAVTKDFQPEENTIRTLFLVSFFSHDKVRCDGDDAASDEKNIRAFENELNKNMQVAFGMKRGAPDATQTVDPVAMGNMAGLLACGAGMKNNSNACFAFDFFTASPTTSPLYRQFAAAVGQLPAGAQKTAAQRCLAAPAGK
jgi:hypothetical protein